MRTCFILLFIVILFQAAAQPAVRKPARAGQWYPADPGGLRRAISGLLAGGAASVNGRVIALIAPHAGYTYCGKAMAAAYRSVQGRDIRRVYILGPAHYGAGHYSIMDVTAYETPLGRVPLDTDTIARLRAQKLVGCETRAHLHEHALESQLPFLQYLFGDKVRIIPILCPSDPAKEDGLAAFISRDMDARTLLVVSSDFTHFGRAFGYRPFAYSRSKIEAMDRQAIDHILALDASGFMTFCRAQQATICGRRAIALLLDVLSRLRGRQGRDIQAKLLDYYTSKDVVPARDETSVSYAAIAFYHLPGGKNKTMLTTAEKNTLLAIARYAIEAHFSGRDMETCKANLTQKFSVTPALEKQQGAFVTLNKHGALRGCIGYIEGIKPLYLTVFENAQNAAFGDPRFNPLQQRELPELHIEISVMSPIEPLTDVNDIQVGRDGLIVKKGWRQGLLLPQVATEYGWDRETFLSHTCRKAGLPADEWKRGVDILRFSALVFAEKDLQAE